MPAPDKLDPDDSPIVLLVDDVPDHHQQYQRALQQNDCRVVLVATGQEALRAARQQSPHCIVIDERLADMTGWQLCRELKQLAATKSIPVILLTQEVSRAAAGKSVEAGCSAWMAHPATADDLVRSVQHVLDTEQSSPSSPDEALLGVHVCIACGAEEVRATLRMTTFQYYRCRVCGFSWRIDVSAPAART